MITNAVMAFLHALAQSVADTITGMIPGPPSFVVDLVEGFNTVYDAVPGAVKYFVPLAPMIVAGTALVGLLVVLGLIRLARRVVSLFTGGGGNA